jgi:hypothetical protein
MLCDYSARRDAVLEVLPYQIAFRTSHGSMVDSGIQNELVALVNLLAGTISEYTVLQRVEIDGDLRP